MRQAQSIRPGYIGRMRRCSAAFALLLLVVVQLLYLGHWQPVAHELETPTGHTEHSQHCHVNVATCSTLPLPSGPGQLLFNQELLTEPELQSTPLLDSEQNAPHDLSIGPLLPPPRILSA